MSAKQDFKEILSQLETDPSTGKITEKIQIYTHSRGGAFGAGYTEELMELIKENADKFQDANHEIDFVLNLAPHQSWRFNEAKGSESFSIDHTWDILSGGNVGNNIAVQTNTAAGSPLTAHENGSFVKEVGAFLDAWKKNKGDDQKVVGEFVKKLKSMGIKVKVKETGDRN